MSRALTDMADRLRSFLDASDPRAADAARQLVTHIKGTEFVTLTQHRALNLRALDVMAELEKARAECRTLEAELTHAKTMLGASAAVTARRDHDALHAASSAFLADLTQHCQVAGEGHPDEAVRDFFLDEDQLVLPVGNGVLYRLRKALGLVENAQVPRSAA